MLGLRKDERAVQDKHFEHFIVAETLKMSEILSFQNFDTISKIHLNISETASYGHLVREQKCSE